MSDAELLELCEEVERLISGLVVTSTQIELARKLARAIEREGWKLVPVEPTDKMLDEGRDAGDFHILHYDGTDKPGTPRYSLRRSYQAMLNAAPEA